jgi:hypothetical protein
MLIRAKRSKRKYNDSGDQWCVHCVHLVYLEAQLAGHARHIRENTDFLKILDGNTDYRSCEDDDQPRRFEPSHPVNERDSRRL